MYQICSILPSKFISITFHCVFYSLIHILDLDWCFTISKSVSRTFFDVFSKCIWRYLGQLYMIPSFPQYPQYPNSLFLVKKGYCGNEALSFNYFIHFYTISNTPKISWTFPYDLKPNIYWYIFLTHRSFTYLFHLIRPFWSVLNVK